METQFNVNTTEKLFSKWLSEFLPREEIPLNRIQKETADNDEIYKLVTISLPHWRGGIKNIYVVTASYERPFPKGGTVVTEKNVITFKFTPTATERMHVKISWDEEEILAEIMAVEILRSIELAYPEARESIDAFLKSYIGENEQDQPKEQQKVKPRREKGSVPKTRLRCLRWVLAWELFRQHPRATFNALQMLLEEEVEKEKGKKKRDPNYVMKDYHVFAVDTIRSIVINGREGNIDETWNEINKKTR